MRQHAAAAGGAAAGGAAAGGAAGGAAGAAAGGAAAEVGPARFRLELGELHPAAAYRSYFFEELVDNPLRSEGAQVEIEREITEDDMGA